MKCEEGRSGRQSEQGPWGTVHYPWNVLILICLDEQTNEEGAIQPRVAFWAVKTEVLEFGGQPPFLFFQVMLSVNGGNQLSALVSFFSHALFFAHSNVPS